jgi:hypothetical protein
MQCGAPAAPRRRHEKIPGRNRIGPVALNGPVPGGRAPSSPTPSPHPADRPRSSAKGRGLPFRGHRYAVGSDLSLGGVRRRIEALMLPDEPIVVLNLDRAVRQERDRRQEQISAGRTPPPRGLHEVRGDARKNAPPAVLVSATGTAPDRDLVSRGFFLSTSRRNQWALDASPPPVLGRLSRA